MQNSRGVVKSILWCQYILYSYHTSQLLTILIQRKGSWNIFYWSGNSNASVINVPCVVNMSVNQYVLIQFDGKMWMIHIYIYFRVHLLAWLLLWVLSTTQGHKIVAIGSLLLVIDRHVNHSVITQRNEVVALLLLRDVMWGLYIPDLILFFQLPLVYFGSVTHYGTKWHIWRYIQKLYLELNHLNVKLWNVCPIWYHYAIVN